MAQIKWDEEGSHFYHTGVNKGVLFPFDNAQNRYGTGVAWNGLKTVTETPEGDESSDIYADNLKYPDPDVGSVVQVHDRGIHLPRRVRRL